MNCNHYRKLLPLNRSGELSDRQAEKLKRHLEQCSDCARIRDRIVQADAVLSAARQTVPRPENPTLLTNRIMNAVQMGPFPHFRPRGVRSHRALRYGFAAAAFLVGAVFFAQESMILSRVSRLEKRMAETVRTRGFEYAGSLGIPSVENRLGTIESIDLKRSYFHDDLVMVRKSDLVLLIKACQDSHAVQSMLLKVIREYDPDVRIVSSDLAAESEKVRRILSENPQMIRHIQRMIQTGGHI